MKLVDRINRNLSNSIGWSTNRKIIVFESDDWGSIRMSSRKNFDRLLEKGIPVDKNHYNSNDSLECNEDLEYLMESLSKFKDSTGRTVVITGVNIVANPDFERIRKNDFQEYFYEPTKRTYSRYPNCDRVPQLWVEAMKNRMIIPVFHGREHLNVQRWMKSLQSGCKSTITAFDCQVTGIRYGINGRKLPLYQASFDLDSKSEIQYHKEVIKTGLHLFEKTYGYKSRHFVPPNGFFNNGLEKDCYENGVRFMGTAKFQREPIGNMKYKKHFKYLGKSNKHGITYLTRNAFFEPNSWNYPDSKDWVNDCLKEIEIAFKWRKPVTISSHRVNYVGRLNPENRSVGLKKLEELLRMILKKWPESEFLTSAELGDVIMKSKN